MHFVANQLGLESKSSGSKAARQLTVRLKATGAAAVDGHAGDDIAGDSAGAKKKREIPAPVLPLSPASEDRLTLYIRERPPHLRDWRGAQIIRALAARFMGHLFRGNAASAGDTRSRGEKGGATGRSASGFGVPRLTGATAATGAALDPAAAAALKSKWEAAAARRAAHPDAKAMAAQRRSLPSWNVRDALSAALRTSQVTIVSGDTGCGKSTQVPQFILDDPLLGPAASIVVTQPRRISAISLAERVASERCEGVGDGVGYNVRLESASSSDTRLLFCTTGVLLRRLTSDPLLLGRAANSGAASSVAASSGDADAPPPLLDVGTIGAGGGVNVVVLDEVHERDINTDFLLIILRDLLPKRPDLRLVIMSATLQLDLYLKYFKARAAARGVPSSPLPADLPCTSIARDVSLVHVAGSAFPVTRYFLEDALSACGYMGGGGAGAARAQATARLAQSLAGIGAGGAAAVAAATTATTAVRVGRAESAPAVLGDQTAAAAVLTAANAARGQPPALPAGEPTPTPAASSRTALPASAGTVSSAGSSAAVPPGGPLLVDGKLPRNTEAIGAPAAGDMSCMLCGRTTFRTAEQFGLHAALCLGPGTTPEDDDVPEPAPTASSLAPALASAAAAGPAPAAAVPTAVAPAVPAPAIPAAAALDARVLRNSDAIGAPEAAELHCSMCSRHGFRSVDAFAAHAAMCLGPGTVPDEEDSQLAAASASVAAADTSATPAVAAASPALTPSASASGTVRTASGLVLPGGIRAKSAAGAVAATPTADGASDGAAASPLALAAASVSRGNTAARDTAIMGPYMPQTEADALIEAYQRAGGRGGSSLDDETVDLDLLVALTAHIVSTSIAAGSGAAARGGAAAAGARTPLDAGLGAVLVFLPGWEDISGAMDLMRGHPVLGNPGRALILPLHSAIPTSEQRRVFKRPPPGVVKIVLSTNIAETSLTIDDIVSRNHQLHDASMY